MYGVRYSEKVVWGGQCVRITAAAGGLYRGHTVLAQHIDRLRPTIRRNLARLLSGRIDESTMYEDESMMHEDDDRSKRESMLPDHRKTVGWCGPSRNWPPDQTRSRKARKVAKLRKERRR